MKITNNSGRKLTEKPDHKKEALVRHAIIGLAFLFFSVSSQAADVIPDSMKQCIGQPCVEATGQVWLRDSPPTGLFYKKGKKLDYIDKSEILIVQEQKTVETLFRNYEWLKVKRIFYKTDGIQIETKVAEGWVFNGTVDGKPYFESIK